MMRQGGAVECESAQRFTVRAGRGHHRAAGAAQAAARLRLQHAQGDLTQRSHTATLHPRIRASTHPHIRTSAHRHIRAAHPLAIARLAAATPRPRVQTKRSSLRAPLALTHSSEPTQPASRRGLSRSETRRPSSNEGPRPLSAPPRTRTLRLSPPLIERGPSPALPLAPLPMTTLPSTSLAAQRCVRGAVLRPLTRLSLAASCTLYRRAVLVVAPCFRIRAPVCVAICIQQLVGVLQACRVWKASAAC